MSVYCRNNYLAQIVFFLLVTCIEIRSEQRRIHAVSQGPFDSTVDPGYFRRQWKRREHGWVVPTFIEILKLLHYTYFCVIRLREIGMPADYVHKLTRMFQDIKISEDLNQQFKKQDRKTKGGIAGNNLELFYWVNLFNKLKLRPRFRQHKNSE